MKQLIELLILVPTVDHVHFLCIPDTEKICVTVGGASPGLPCIFPFTFNGAEHHECTWDQAHLTEHLAWCSTQVDETGHHIGGQGKWGNCGEGCPVPPDPRNATVPSSGRPQTAF